MRNFKCFAVGFTFGVVAMALSIEARADEPGIEWITGKVGEDNVNLMKNQITEEWSWTTGTIGDDSVNINELEITEEWSWSSGTIGDDTVNLNSLKIDWETDDED